MTISSTAMRAMVAAGATAEMLIAAVEADERAAEDKVAKRREATAARVRKHRETRRNAGNACNALHPSSPPDAPPAPPAPPHPPLNPPSHPGSDPDGSAAAEGEQAGCGQAEEPQRPDHRRDLLTRGVVLVKAITGRSEIGARQLIGHLLGVARDEAVRVLAVIEDADGRELADPVGWMKRQLEERRDHGSPPRPAYQPAPTGQAARLATLYRQRQERTHASDHGTRDFVVIEGDRAGEPDDASGGGEAGRGPARPAQADRRAPDPLLRAFQSRAEHAAAQAALRRRGAPGAGSR